MINSYGSYQRSPGLMELAMMERRGEITASQFVEFAAKRKRASKADDSKSQECFRADGSSYRIALMRNGKKTTCGGAKTQKKQAETPKAKTAAAGVKKEADKVKEAGSFKGAIGGLKNGKQYDITPEMAAAAQKMGVSDRQLAVGRVPKAVQADLIKEFDRLSAGGKPETGEKGGAIVPVKSALQKAQEETNERKGRGTREKTPEERLDQFSSIAQKLVESIEKRRDQLASASKDELVNPDQLRKKADSELKSAREVAGIWENMTPKQYIKQAEDQLKKQRAAIRAEKDPDMKELLKQFADRDKARLEKIKQNPEASLESRRKAAQNMLEMSERAADQDFDKVAQDRNADLISERDQLEKSISTARKRMEKAWAAIQTLDSPRLNDAFEQLGVTPSGNPAEDMKLAKAAFRKRAQETHPDRGGDPDEFQAVSQSWDIVRSAQVAGGGPPLINPFLQEIMQDAGFDFDYALDL